jgi:hypothetical protein
MLNRRMLVGTMVTALTLGACADSGPADPSDPSGALPMAAANAPLIVDIPADHPGPPWYTLVFSGGAEPPSGYIPNDGTWAAVTFWREPSCVPADFNLLLVLDLEPLDPPDDFRPRAFGCDLTVSGRVWFVPGITIPTQERYFGLGAVPIYFALLSEVQSVAGDSPADPDSDPDIYIGELAGLPSLNIGYADRFEMVIHNSDKAANPGHEVADARGTIGQGLFAGRPFRYHHNERFDPETGVHSYRAVRISFE